MIRIGACPAMGELGTGITMESDDQFYARPVPEELRAAETAIAVND